jgi:hypothetical protein
LAGAAPAAADTTDVAAFLHLLARAVRQVRTYPLTSATCLDAIAACHKALVARDAAESVFVRVTPRELLVGETAVGAGTIIEQELALRLHRARVGSLSIDGTALPRHLSRFCSDLIDVSERRDLAGTLADVLGEHGIDTIIADTAHRPEVLSIGAPAPALTELAAAERQRREALLADGGPPTHLYPPDKGWIRLDPTSKLDSVSLVDLAVLVESPVTLADMLMRLTGDEADALDGQDSALEKKFSEVTTLFASLDPRLAAVMFQRLAGAVLNLDPDRRTALLQRTILPGLLDGNVDGHVLKDFPDVTLAESLCLLLDLEAAAPEVISAALDRLELPDVRRDAMLPLLETQLRQRAAKDGAPDAGAGSSVDRRALELLRVETREGKSFADFMAFDLTIDDQAQAAIDGISAEIRATDTLARQLACLERLVRLEPNPGQTERLLARGSLLLAELEHARRWEDLAPWIVRHQELADRLAPQRPDVAAAISTALDDFCTPARVWALVEVSLAGEDTRAAAHAVADALGGRFVPAALALLEDSEAQALAAPLVDLMCAHAKRLAPGLAARIGRSGPVASRAIARVLGAAGPGYEKTLAPLLDRTADEAAARTALDALVRMGTPQAALIVSRQIQGGASWLRTAAEGALTRFPPSVVRTRLRELIGRRELLVGQPELGVRLIERAVAAGVDGLEPALTTLVSLRFRFWNMPLARLGRAARRQLTS